jgi:hypothetical protein
MKPMEFTCLGQESLHDCGPHSRSVLSERSARSGSELNPSSGVRGQLLKDLRTAMTSLVRLRSISHVDLLIAVISTWKGRLGRTSPCSRLLPRCNLSPAPCSLRVSSGWPSPKHRPRALLCTSPSPYRAAISRSGQRRPTRPSTCASASSAPTLPRSRSGCTRCRRRRRASMASTSQLRRSARSRLRYLRR